jgi:SAM-dependent MidA family methyltransferase
MEVGPGKGTLMDDMLRVSGCHCFIYEKPEDHWTDGDLTSQTFRNFKMFSSSVEAIYLVEASATLREVQKRLLCGEEAAMEETDIGHKSLCKYFDVPVVWVEDIRLLPHGK